LRLRNQTTIAYSQFARVAALWRLLGRLPSVHEV
jgi:hypothetical protein